MDYQLDLKKKLKLNIEIRFALGIASTFIDDNKVIEEYQYKTILDGIDEKFLKLSLKEKIKTLWILSKRTLREKLGYLKYREGNITYTYKGPTMKEM